MGVTKGRACRPYTETPIPNDNHPSRAIPAPDGEGNEGWGEFTRRLNVFRRPTVGSWAYCDSPTHLSRPTVHVEPTEQQLPAAESTRTLAAPSIRQTPHGLTYLPFA